MCDWLGFNYLGNDFIPFGVPIGCNNDESKTEGGICVFVNLVARLLSKIQVGNDCIKMGRTFEVQAQEVRDIL